MNYKKSFNLLTLISILLALFSIKYWKDVSYKIWSFLDNSKYSSNKVLGLKVSRYIDTREEIGTRTSLHSYLDFLTFTTRSISDKFSTIDPFYQFVYHDKKFRISTLTDNEYTFGIQSLHSFKIKQLNDLPSNYFNRWVKLVDKNKFELPVYLLSANKDELIVRGFVPIWFFPKFLVIEDNIKTGSKLDLSITNNIGSIVRGGYIPSLNDQYLFHTFNVPLNRFKKKYNPSIGDKIKFNNGKELIISYVNQFDGQYLIGTKDKPFKPFRGIRNDIVTIIKNKKPVRRKFKFIINQDTKDKNFFYGKNRYMSIKLAEPLKENLKYAYFDNNIFLEDNRIPLSLALGGKDKIVIDFAETLASLLCKNYKENTSLDSEIELKILLEVCLNSENIYNINSEKIYNFDEKILNSYSISEKIRALNINFAHNFYRSLDSWIYSKNRNNIIKPESESKYVFSNKVITNNKINLNKEFDIWEIYPGSMLNLYYEKNNPAPTELLIHALNKKDRDNYLNEFKKLSPEYMAFAKPRQFTPWLINMHWLFFEHLISNYENTFSNVDFAFWEKTEKLNTIKTDFFKINNPIFPLTVYPPKISSNECNLRVASVKLDIDYKNSYSYLPLIGKSERFFIYIEGTSDILPSKLPVSLPPESGYFDFPIVFNSNKPLNFLFEKLSPLGSFAEMKIKSINISERKYPQDRLKELFLEDNSFKQYFEKNCKF